MPYTFEEHSLQDGQRAVRLVRSQAADPVDRLDGRTAFQMLVYPGPLGIPSQLPAGSPPAFMVIAADDLHASVVINLMHLFRQADIDYEAHVYARGGHGFGVKKSARRSLEHWPDRMIDWLHDEAVREGRAPITPAIGGNSN